MPTPVRYLEPAELSALGPTLVAAIEKLLPGMRDLLRVERDRPDTIAVVALDTTGVLGFATASEHAGPLVAMKTASVKVKAELRDRIQDAARERWPGWRGL